MSKALIKKNNVLGQPYRIHAPKRMDLDTVALSEGSQTQKAACRYDAVA